MIIWALFKQKFVFVCLSYLFLFCVALTRKLLARTISTRTSSIKDILTLAKEMKRSDEEVKVLLQETCPMPTNLKETVLQLLQRWTEDGGTREMLLQVLQTIHLVDCAADVALGKSLQVFLFAKWFFFLLSCIQFIYPLYCNNTSLLYFA